MNDTEFEAMARQAAEVMRREAADVADSEASLAALLRDRRPPNVDRGEPAIVDLSDRPQDRPRIVLPLLVAAATVIVIGGVALVSNRGGDDGFAPTAPSDPPPQETVSRVVDTPTTISAGETAEPAEPVATDSPTTQPTVEPDPVVSIPDELGQAIDRRVIWSTSVGNGEAQVGWENCGECEPLRPWGPIVMPDGDLYVADVVNERWLWWDSDTYVETPFAPGDVVVAAPVLGPDGFIYAAVAESLTDRANLRVIVYDPADMSPIGSEFAVTDSRHDRLEVVNDVLHFGSQEVTSFESSLGTPTVGVEGRVVTIALSGVQERYELPAGWTVELGDIAPVGDGSVVMRAMLPSPDGPEAALVRLWLDGTVSTGTVTGANAAAGSAVQLGELGLVQLERQDDVVEVIRYPLPDFPGADPLAGWTVPELVTPSIDQVPRLLPQQPVPGVVTSVRSEYADQRSDRTAFHQTFVRPDPTGSIDAAVELTTNLEPAPVQTARDRAEIDGWPLAYFADTSGDVVVLQLYSPTRSLVLWGAGIDRAEAAALATDLVVDGDGVGWAAPQLDEANDWLPVHEGWQVGAASRTLVQEAPGGGERLELWVVAGVPGAISTPGWLNGDVRLDEIDGRPVLLFDQGDDRSGMTWSPQEGVVVVLGSYGPLDDLIETARSLTEVDQATWNAVPVDPADDGCHSMWC